MTPELKGVLMILALCSFVIVGLILLPEIEVDDDGNENLL
jgi:hypothetical protein